MFKFFIFIVGMGLGFVVIYYHRWFAGILGRSSMAERYFGPTGTYTMWKLIGLIIMVVTVLYTFGAIDKILNLASVFGQ
ncbi:MAG TPA: hypothetical protein P5096_04150 [Patescibacteria group bacterium]|nr:hypothetical protein [Patescibacteria group bacterium]